MKRIAAVEERKGRLFVQSWSQTRGAHPLQMANEWLEVADDQVTDESLGHLLRRALGESQSGLPYESVHALTAAARKKKLSAAGVKLYAAYERDLRCVFVSLREDEGFLEIAPYHQAGQGQNFTSIAGAEIRLAADVDDDLLGSEIRRALRVAN